MAEGPCFTNEDCHGGFSCKPEGDEYAMPGFSVCVLTDKNSWPELDKNSALGLSLFTPTWYDISKLVIKGAALNIGYIIESIATLIWNKAKSLVGGNYNLALVELFCP